jgi:hypothetical protein
MGTGCYRSPGESPRACLTNRFTRTIKDFLSERTEGDGRQSAVAESNLSKLTRYTKARIISRHHAAAARNPHIDIRFAFTLDADAE